MLYEKFPKQRTLTEGVYAENAEENIWNYERGSKRMLHNEKLLVCTLQNMNLLSG
jgi:hypothetical protein